MNTDFARTLSLLRQEKGVSQRTAAQALEISQALLSHYENGIREPGLAFVTRACAYYHVSADFLLGRTLSRNGTVILNLAQAGAPAGEEEEQFRMRRLVLNAMEMVFALLAETNCPEAEQAAVDFMGMGAYILFRHLYRAGSRFSEDLFSVPPSRFAAGEARLDLLASEIEYMEALTRHAKEKGAFPNLSAQALQEEGVRYQSLLEIIHTAGERINRQIQSREQ